MIRYLPNGTFEGDPEDIAATLHLLAHHVHDHIWSAACEVGEPEAAEHRYPVEDHQGERGRVVPVRRTETRVAHVLVGETPLEVDIPGDGATASWVIDRVVGAVTGTPSGPVCLLDVAAGTVLGAASTPVLAGRVYRLCGFSA